MKLVAARFWLGLTATPKRRDGLSAALAEVHRSLVTEKIRNDQIIGDNVAALGILVIGTTPSSVKGFDVPALDTPVPCGADLV